MMKGVVVGGWEYRDAGRTVEVDMRIRNVLDISFTLQSAWCAA
jgi:hypothetical protein